jgi:outer membrane protein assembly factor BamC
MKRSALLMALIALLAGCSTSLFDSKKVEYKSAGKLPPLEVPPDLTQPTADDRYAVPDVAPKGTATYSAYAGDRRGGTTAAAAQEVLPQVDKMHVERDGNERWLVVAGTPDKLWPEIKQFWQDMGLIVNIEKPEAGVMETDWAENRAKIPQDFIRRAIGKVFDDVYSTPERDKFRTRLEPGKQPGTTEIYISHRGMYEVYVNEGKSDTRWEPRPPDPDLEAEMLRQLMVRLGADDTRAKAMLADAGSTAPRAKLDQARGGGTGVLEVLEPFDRAWRRVGLALDRVGFTVEDRDRSQGLYYVRYVDPEAGSQKKEKGFLSKLAFWQSSKSDADSSPKYRIRVQGSGDSSSVEVFNTIGGQENSDTSKKILTLLYEQLK